MLYFNDKWDFQLNDRDSLLDSKDKILEQKSLWNHTKSHELFKDRDDVLEVTFGLKFSDGYAKAGVVVDENATATTPEEIDREVLKDLRELSNLDRTSTAIAFENDVFLDNKDYRGPFLPALIECSKEFGEGLNSIIVTMKELENKDNLTWDSLSAAINEKELPCEISKSVYDKNSYDFKFFPPSLMNSIKCGDQFGVINEYLDYNHSSLDTPEDLLFNLSDNYMHDDGAINFITGCLVDILDGKNHGILRTHDEQYLDVLEYSKALCEKASDMAKELEHALEFDRDKAKEQDVTDPNKSVKPWAPDSAKKAQTRSKGGKSKDEMER